MSNEQVKLLDNLVLNENDFTEEAKRRFTFCTDILNAFNEYRRRILHDNSLSPISRHALFHTLNIFYTKCQQVLNYMAEHSELLSGSLPTMGPVIVCGLPRTGTTLLYNLLACDTRCRAPLFTEMYIHSVPPIAHWSSVEQEQRAAVAKVALSAKTNHPDGTANDMELSHPFFEIEEDYLILHHAGAAIFLSTMICDDLASFNDYLSVETKKDFVYEYHKTFLQMLNSIDAPSSHWLLKSPVHLLLLDTLFQHYPNTAMIMTHRNIAETLPSFCRLMVAQENLYAMKTDSPAVRAALTTQYTQLFDRMVECLMDFRRRQPMANIFDVTYDGLMAEPIDTVHRIYDHFGLQRSDEFETAMKAWLDKNPQAKRGRHIYSLEEFGLIPEDIENRYADYTNLFLRVPTVNHSDEHD